MPTGSPEHPSREGALPREKKAELPTQGFEKRMEYALKEFCKRFLDSSFRDAGVVGRSDTMCARVCVRACACEWGCGSVHACTYLYSRFSGTAT